MKYIAIENIVYNVTEADYKILTNKLNKALKGYNPNKQLWNEGLNYIPITRKYNPILELHKNVQSI